MLCSSSYPTLEQLSVFSLLKILYKQHRKYQIPRNKSNKICTETCIEFYKTLLRLTKEDPNKCRTT